MSVEVRAADGGRVGVSLVAGAPRVTAMPRPGWEAAGGLLGSPVAALESFRGVLGGGRWPGGLLVLRGSG
jgi:hypothetical protein